MANDMSANHITLDELEAYVAGELPEEDEERIEDHIGGCEACTEEVRQIRAFSVVWDDWVGESQYDPVEQVVLQEALEALPGRVEASTLAAEGHRDTVLWELVDQSLQTAAAEARTDVPRWQERLAQWRLATARLAQELGRSLADAVLGPGLTPATVKVRGTGRGTPSAGIRVALVGGPWAEQTRVAVDEHAREISLRIDNVPHGQAPPLALLAHEGHKARFVQLTRLPDGQSLFARFEEVELGDYVLALEPRESN